MEKREEGEEEDGVSASDIEKNDPHKKGSLDVPLPLIPRHGIHTHRRHTPTSETEREKGRSIKEDPPPTMDLHRSKREIMD